MSTPKPKLTETLKWLLTFTLQDENNSGHSIRSFKRNWYAHNFVPIVPKLYVTMFVVDGILKDYFDFLC
jgi:hypothetical protein